MTQLRVQSEHFGSSWPEVEGFGAGPNEQNFSCFGRRAKCEKFASVLTLELLAVCGLYPEFLNTYYHDKKIIPTGEGKQQRQVAFRR